MAESKNPKVYECLECGVKKEESPTTHFQNRRQCKKCFNRSNYIAKKQVWVEYYKDEERRLKNIELSKKRYYENRPPEVLERKLAREQRLAMLREEILSDNEKRKAKLAGKEKY